MTNYNIQLQDRYSRVELILRSLFGVFYIVLPHTFLLIFLGLWGGILTIIAWWVVLFTGRYPQSFFEYQEKLIRWNTRLSARVMHLSDGYPAFGLDAKDEHVEVEIEYPEKISRGVLILRLLFGAIYVLIPHGFVLFFRTIASSVLSFLAWFAVLFTARYPASWHEFNVGTLRWGFRVNLYMSFMTDEYPPFSGRP